MAPSQRYVVVGLGNPGRRYAYTRHNVGYRVVEEMARRHRIRLWRRRFRAVCGKGRICGREVWLLKPQTFMNLSGEAVSPAVGSLRCDAQRLLLVLDDISLPLGALRFREKGSAGGHKGLMSVIEELGTEAFPRLRVGIGMPPPGQDAAAYVLARFSAAEEKTIAQTVARAADAVETWLTEGATRTMARYNT